MKKGLFMGVFLLFSVDVFAAPIAKVLFTANTVTASYNGIIRTLSRGSNLEIGDVVKTGAKGMINIRYNNGALVNIGENSVYRIVNYSEASNIFFHPN